MLCPNCKKEIENGSAFCEYCGTRIKKSKKSLWITLSVIFMAAVVTIVVITVQEQIAMERYRVEQHQLELEQQLQAEREARQEAERQAEHARLEAIRKAELLRNGYVDLGLPSGTLWKNSNEGGDNVLYTFDEARRRFGEKLPTIQQLKELKNKCIWSRSGNNCKIIGPNGNHITLPAAGIRSCHGDLAGIGITGSYWSSSLGASGAPWQIYFCFDSSNLVEVSVFSDDECHGYSVRLVQNP